MNSYCSIEIGRGVSLQDIFAHIYLPLLTQETGIMVSTFTYGLRAGATSLLLVLVNTAAVITDLLIFFVPIHFLSSGMQRRLVGRFRDRYDTGQQYVERFGAFRTSAVLGFVMPSVAAMVVVALLRLSFWRALAGLFLGSAIYVALPLIIALPLAASLPKFVVPLLPWAAPVLLVLFLLLAGIRALWKARTEPSKGIPG